MSERYGKIKNGKLILAPQFINRDGAITFDNQTLYIENGYKKLIYTTPPDNIEGRDLISSWDERQDSIIQTWTYEEIKDDYSGELLVAVRQFDECVEDLKNEIKKNYGANKEYLNIILRKNSLIALIYKHKPIEVTTHQLLKRLSEFDWNLERFFDWLQMNSILKDMGFIFVEGNLFYSSNELNEVTANEILHTDLEQLSAEQKQLIDRNLIAPMYFKSRLSSIYDYETYSTISNITMYNMAFVYLFTQFDELILKTIRIVCMHEKKWLISNEKIGADEILKCNTTDELHMALVEKKVNELSWGSYTDKLNFLKNRGIIIDEEHDMLFNESILYLSAKRNVLVHNGGLWNQASKDLLKGKKVWHDIVVGEPVIRTYESFVEASNSVEAAISYIYNQLCNKFKFLFKYKDV